MKIWKVSVGLAPSNLLILSQTCRRACDRRSPPHDLHRGDGAVQVRDEPVGGPALPLPLAERRRLDRRWRVRLPGRDTRAAPLLRRHRPPARIGRDQCGVAGRRWHGLNHLHSRKRLAADCGGCGVESCGLIVRKTIKYLPKHQSLPACPRRSASFFVVVGHGEGSGSPVRGR